MSTYCRCAGCAIAERDIETGPCLCMTGAHSPALRYDVHIVQMYFDGDTSTAYCWCGWGGTRWITTLTTDGWESATREALEHKRSVDQCSGDDPR